MAQGFEQTDSPAQSFAFVDVGDRLLLSFCAVAFSALLIGISVSAHPIHPIFAIFISFVFTVALANWMPGVAIIAVIFAALFQNLFVSIISPHLINLSDVNIARGYSFIILCSAWAVAFLTYFFREKGKIASLDQMMKVTTIVFALIGVYFVIGFVQNPLGSIISLRSTASAFMFFQMGLVFFALYPLKLSYAFTIIGFILVIFGYIEFFYREEWMVWTNGQTFWDLTTTAQRESGLWDKDAAELGIVSLGFLDSITVDLFNTPLLDGLKITITRLLGPNFHAISYAYGLAFFFIFALYRGSFVLAILLAPLLLFANAKGAIILLILVGLSWIVARVFGAKFGFGVLSAVLLLYIAVGIFIGLAIGDFHVLGFMGGVYNFLGNPIGHGLGAGGNLSTNFSTLDWSEYQAAGRTPIAIESAVGVMMFQMGIGAFIYIGTCIWISWKTVCLGASTKNSLHIVAGFALITILVNGIFQEEALFSPSGFGLIMALNGMILGAAIRTGAFR